MLGCTYLGGVYGCGKCGCICILRSATVKSIFGRVDLSLFALEDVALHSHLNVFT